jgi:predicted amino acid dehydrogenase
MPDQIEILSVSIGSSKRDHELSVPFMGRTYHIRRIGTNGDKMRAIRLIREADGKVAAIGLGGADVFFRVGGKTYVHQDAKRLMDAARVTPVVDGGGLKHTLERWAIKWVLEKRPGLFDNKRVLVMSALDRYAIAEVLSEYTKQFIFGDWMYALKLPFAPRSLKTITANARILLPILTHIPFDAIYPTGKRQDTVRPIFQKPFRWAEVIVGDYHFIRRYAPSDLEGKIVITNTVMGSDEEDLKGRGVTTLITTTPEMDGRSFGANVLEAMFVAHLSEQGVDVPSLSFDEQRDEYINLILQSGIEPRLIDLSPPPSDNVARFAFIVHPITLDDLFQAPQFRPFRAFPKALVEESAAKIPPLFVGKATGIITPSGKEAQGYIFGLPSTPRMMMKLPPEHFYRQMAQIARMAKEKNAGIIGLGAFTSVIGDAGVTLSKMIPIAVTTGNSYTVWATLEAVTDGARRLGIDIGKARGMVIGATGSIGKAITRMMAERMPELVIIAPKPERLMELARQLEAEAQKSGRSLKVEVGTSADHFLPTVDIVVASTSARGGIIDVMKLKPGALVCDVAMPPDVNREEAGKRDDVLVIASGEILVPGDIHWGVNLGLPKNVGFACLAETVLLALEGRNENFTLGREIDIERVKEIGEIGKKHGFKLAPIMSFGKEVTGEEIARVRRKAGRG